MRVVRGFASYDCLLVQVLLPNTVKAASQSLSVCDERNVGIAPVSCLGPRPGCALASSRAVSRPPCSGSLPTSGPAALLGASNRHASKLLNEGTACLKGQAGQVLFEKDLPSLCHPGSLKSPALSRAPRGCPWVSEACRGGLLPVHELSPSCLPPPLTVPPQRSSLPPKG